MIEFLIFSSLKFSTVLYRHCSSNSETNERLYKLVLVIFEVLPAGQPPCPSIARQRSRQHAKGCQVNLGGLRYRAVWKAIMDGRNKQPRRVIIIFANQDFVAGIANDQTGENAGISAPPAGRAKCRQEQRSENLRKTVSGGWFDCLQKLLTLLVDQRRTMFNHRGIKAIFRAKMVMQQRLAYTGTGCKRLHPQPVKTLFGEPKFGRNKDTFQRIQFCIVVWFSDGPHKVTLDSD
nr:hypothetical protein [Actibacterium mucosum]